MKKPSQDGLKLKRFGEGRSLFVRQGFDSRQFLSFEELERRSATGGNMGHLIRNLGAVDRRDRVAATHNRNRPHIFRNGMGDFEGPARESWNLKHPHRSVPHDGSSP